MIEIEDILFSYIKHLVTALMVVLSIWVLPKKFSSDGGCKIGKIGVNKTLTERLAS